MNKFRRHFIRKLSSLLAIIAASPAMSIIPTNENQVGLSEDEKRQIRLGNWIIQHLSYTQNVELMRENAVFLTKVDNMSEFEKEGLIAADFLNDRTVNIQGVLFSSKESAFLVHMVTKHTSIS